MPGFNRTLELLTLQIDMVCEYRTVVCTMYALAEDFNERIIGRACFLDHILCDYFLYVDLKSNVYNP